MTLNRKFTFVLIVVLLLLSVAVVTAQTPLPTVAAGETVTEAIATVTNQAAAPEGDLTTIALLSVIAGQFLVIAFLVFKNTNNIPPEIVSLLFTYAESVTRSTPQTWDDEAVAELKSLANRLTAPTAAPAPNPPA